MRITKRSAILLLASSFVADAASLCVKLSPTGDGSGADWNNALGASFAPVRGNTYYIADGVYGGKIWNTANSGNTTVTIKKATIADHGTDAGWSDTLGDGEALWNGWEIFTDYWVFDGQWRTETDPNQWDGAFSGIGYGFRVSGGGTSGKAIRLDNAAGTGCDNTTFRYLDARGGGSGSGSGDDVVYGLTGNSNITFDRCSLRDSDRTIFLLRGEWQNLLVQYCFLGRNNSTPAIHGEMLSDVGSDNLTFRYNIIEDTEGTSFGFAVLNGSGSKNSENTANGWKIYGNVFRSTANGGDCSAACIYCANDASNRNWLDNCKVYNNTFVNINLAFDYIIYQDVPGSGNEAVNNVFYNLGKGGWTGGTKLSYNFYYNTGSGGDSGTGKIVCNSGCSTFFREATRGNMMLAQTLAGTVLDPEYATDMFGSVRGADGIWDRGAFEFRNVSTNPVISVSLNSLSFGSVPLNAARDMTFNVQNAGGGVLAGNASVSPPFSIAAGGSYSLGSGQSGVVILRFRPTIAGSFSQLVTLTGGGGEAVSVSGSASAGLEPPANLRAVSEP